MGRLRRAKPAASTLEKYSEFYFQSNRFYNDAFGEQKPRFAVSFLGRTPMERAGMMRKHQRDLRIWEPYGRRLLKLFGPYLGREPKFTKEIVPIIAENAKRFRKSYERILADSRRVFSQNYLEEKHANITEYRAALRKLGEIAAAFEKLERDAREQTGSE